jgi:hypothetical protein
MAMAVAPWIVSDELWSRFSQPLVPKAELHFGIQAGDFASPRFERSRRLSFCDKARRSTRKSERGGEL